MWEAFSPKGRRSIVNRKTVGCPRGGRLATYELAIAQDNGRIMVEREILKFRRGQRGKPWQNEPRMYGKQQALSKPVDFGAQRGIYILYGHHTVIYVGRSVDRPLGCRIFEHTIDRLGSRWNRFSWFGLLDVTDEGNLIEVPLKVSMQSLIATLEALLIETLDPPQNRKRGDDFSVKEYIQDIDPELKERATEYPPSNRTEVERARLIPCRLGRFVKECCVHHYKLW